MSVIVKHNGKKWTVDYCGFRLQDAQDNSSLVIKPDEDWYDYVRDKYGISKLTSEHIEILEFYQEFFNNYGIASTVHIAAKTLKKTESSILKIFGSRNPRKVIIEMAGLPMPIGWKNDCENG